MKGAVLFITAFPVGNYRGSGAGEQISLLRIQRLARQHDRVVVLVCSHVAPPEGIAQVLPGNVTTHYARVEKSQILRRALRTMKRPAIFRYRDTGTTRGAIADLLREEAIQEAFFDFSQTFSLVNVVPAEVRRTALVHDVQYQRTARRLGLSRWTAGSVRSEEGQVLSCFDSVVALSAKDAGLLRSLYGIEATVDDWESLFAADTHRGLPSCVAPRERSGEEGTRLLFYGNMRRSENWLGLLLFLTLFAASKVLLGPVKPHRLLIVGECPGWLRAGLRMFPKTVRVTGFVEEPYRWLASADLFLAPLLTGAGVKVKVKEYQRFSAPVYGTPTAFEGLTRRPADSELSIRAMAHRIVHSLRIGV